MIEKAAQQHPPGKQRYTSVVEGMELANEFARSRLSVSEFARQRGVSSQMVRYWCGRARRLAAAAKPDLVQVAELSASGVIKPMPQVPALPAPMTRPATIAPLSMPQPSAMPPTAAPPTIELRLPNGLRIGIGVGFSPEVLSQVIACVGGRSC